MLKRYPLVVFLTLLLFTSCSTTKDKWVNRKYHETTARFNAYFNGLEAYDQAVLSFEKTEELDFEKLLPLYYWPDEKQSTALFSKMDRALEKSAKVIKQHSMVFRGKQKNDYVVKAYLLIARSRFYKNELIQTLEATSYLEDQFGGIEKAKEELFWAKILAAQTHIRMDNAFQAEPLIDDVYTKELPKDQKHAAQKVYAYYFLHEQNWAEAIEWVAAAALTAPTKEDKVRLTYISAQLYGKLGMGYESAISYNKVLKLHPNDYDITFSAQIKRAENFDVYMEDIAVIVKELTKMLKDDKNITYRDQIYYVWALKELDLEHYPDGEALLRNSIESSVSNPKQKGKSYLRLAGIEFDFRDFYNAQAYYDSAISFLPADYAGLDTLKERTEVLNELVALIDVVALEDSLQSMFGMSEGQLRKKFQAHIENKKKQEAETARRAEIAALNAAKNAQLADAGPTAGSGSGQWYFYNPQVRSKGLAAFKRAWGDRVLEDHWRTKDKPVEGFGTGDLVLDNPEDTSVTQADLLPVDDNNVDYYMARTLQNEGDLNKSLTREGVAKASLGFVYKDGLHDLMAAQDTWMSYMKEFSALSQTTPKVLYGEYLLFNETAREEQRDEVKERLLNDFPNSPFAALLRGERDGPSIPAKEQKAYDDVFAAYNDGANTRAQEALTSFKTTYPNSALSPKAALLQAYVFGAKGDEKETQDQLKEVIKSYSGTKEATRAAQILALLMDEKTVDGKQTKGSGDQKVIKVDFEDQSNAPHKVILVLPAENAKINELRNGLADFNKEHFKFDNLRIQNIFYDKSTQLVIISGLRSKAKALVYLNTFNEQGTALGQFYPKEMTELFYINNPNFGKVYRDKVLKEYIQYFKEL